VNLAFGRAFTYVTQEANYIVKILIGGGIIFAGFAVSLLLELVFSIIIAGRAFGTFGGSRFYILTTGESVGLYLLSIIVALIAAIIFIPIVGYQVQVMRNTITGQQPTLPEWADFSQFFTDGVKLWLCMLVVSLPLIVINFGSRLPAAFSPYSTSLGLFSLCGACLALPLSFLVALIAPIVYGRYAATRDIAQTLNFSAIFATLQANLSMYLILGVAQFGIAIVAGIVSAFTCFLGLPFIAFYIGLVGAHLYGQAHLIAQGGTAPPAYNAPYGGPPYGGPPPPYGGQRPF
jgi:Protein of unknown function (DUF4013)